MTIRGSKREPLAHVGPLPTEEEAQRVMDSVFMEECHECDNQTRHMWKTKRCTVRACCLACAEAFANGKDAE